MEQKTNLAIVNKIGLMSQLNQLSTEEQMKIANQLTTSVLDKLAAEGKIDSQYGVTLCNPNGKYPEIDALIYPRPNLGAMVVVVGSDNNGELVILLLPAANKAYTVGPPEGYMVAVRPDYMLSVKERLALDRTVKDTAFRRVIAQTGIDFDKYPDVEAQLLTIVSHEQNPERNQMHMAAACFLMDFTRYRLPEVANGSWYKVSEMEIKGRELFYQGELLFSDERFPDYVQSIEVFSQAVKKVFDNQLMRESKISFDTLESRILPHDRVENLLGVEGLKYASKILSKGKLYARILDNNEASC